MEISKKPSINPVNNFDTLYEWSSILNLNDSGNVSQIQVDIGSYEDGQNIMTYAFDFDEDFFLPAGYSYRRTGNQITLGLGNFKEREYHIRMRLRDTSEVYTQYERWNNQQ